MSTIFKILKQEQHHRTIYTTTTTMHCIVLPLQGFLALQGKGLQTWMWKQRLNSSHDRYTPTTSSQNMDQINVSNKPSSGRIWKFGAISFPRIYIGLVFFFLNGFLSHKFIQQKDYLLFNTLFV